MLKSEMQHQFWITKKTVQRKFGSKEDEHIISSDAELDAKIEVFKSISETSAQLSKIIEQYQDRLCILSQEECVFGRFLKEAGKRSKTTGSSITNTGKAVSYSGQQRMCVRVPLLRLQHEVNVFRYRAVLDTHATIQAMEKERTEYRAALAWMKFASSELDPDTGKGLDKFRTAQSAVRAAKHNFDGLSLDSIQKIDLLAAARCNMYSHALVSYMTELRQFAQKTASTYEAIAQTLTQRTKYDFCVLKDLTQDEGSQKEEPAETAKISTIDKDQSLFFADEFSDEADGGNDDNQQKSPTAKSPQPREIKAKLKETDDARKQEATTTLGGGDDRDDDEQILVEITQQIDDLRPESPSDGERHQQQQAQQQTSFNSIWTKMFHHGGGGGGGVVGDGSQQPLLAAEATQNAHVQQQQQQSNQQLQQQQSQNSNTKNKTNRWLELFAELDPLANPIAFDLKLNEGRTNFQKT